MSANQKRTPRTRWDNDQDGGRNADGSPQVSIRRVAYGVVAVLCPIGVALGWVLRLIVSREVVWRRVSGRLVLASDRGSVCLSMMLTGCSNHAANA